MPFEYLLPKAAELYEKHPPEEIELEVQLMVIQEYVFYFDRFVFFPSLHSTLIIRIEYFTQEKATRTGTKRGSKTTIAGSTQSGRQEFTNKSIIATDFVEQTNRTGHNRIFNCHRHLRILL